MRRTNVYLEDRQLRTLRKLGRSRGEPIAALVREAVDSWLESQGAQTLDRDEWERRFDALLERRGEIAHRHGFSEAGVERDVLEAVREVREARAAGRR